MLSPSHFRSMQVRVIIGGASLMFDRFRLSQALLLQAFNFLTFVIMEVRIIHLPFVVCLLGPHSCSKAPVTCHVLCALRRAAGSTLLPGPLQLNLRFLEAEASSSTRRIVH